MNEKTDLQIKDEFSMRRIRQRISSFIYLVLFLLVFLFRETVLYLWSSWEFLRSILLCTLFISV